MVRIPWVDVKLALRMLVKYPALTLVAVISMSVAVAVVAVAFAITDNFLQPRLPFASGDRVVALQHWDMSAGASEPVPMADYMRWRDELASVEILGAFTSAEQEVSRDGESSMPARVAEVTSTAFDVAEATPLLGRPLVEADQEPQAEPVVLLGYQLWQDLFGGAPEVLGRTLRVGESLRTVVGVMPEGFRFPLNHSAWTPLRTALIDGATSGNPPVVIVFGRLADGIAIGQARAELSVVGQHAAEELAGSRGTLRPRVVPYAHQWVGASRVGYVGVRLGLVALLLVVGANVGALVLARNLTRGSEIAVRTALGARRVQIVWQLTMESLVLVSLASLSGLLVASWGLGLASRVMADSVFGVGGLPFWWNEGLTTGSVVPIAVLCVTSAVLCGSVPALLVTSAGEWGRLRDSTSSSWSPRVGLGAKAVVAAQFALSVGLLTVAAAEWPDMVRNEAAIEGLAAGSFLTAVVRPESTNARRAVRMLPATMSTMRRNALEERLRAEPDVLGVTFATALPGMLHLQARTETDEAGGRSDQQPVRYASVDPAFFDVMGARLRAGRGFTEEDVTAVGSHPVAVVNESYAEDRLGGRSVLGRRIRIVRRNGDAGPWHEIVGVVQDFGMNSIDPSRPAGFYIPLEDDQTRLAVALRTTGDPARLGPSLRTIGAGLEAGTVTESVRPLSAIIRSAREQRRMEYFAVALGTLAVLILTIGGLSAVMSFVVSRRTHEIGIRRALGADALRVAIEIYAGAARRLGWGAAAGIPTGVIFGSVVLEGGSASVALKVSCALLAVGLVACVPATRRLIQVDPGHAMRGEA